MSRISVCWPFPISLVMLSILVVSLPLGPAAYAEKANLRAMSGSSVDVLLTLHAKFRGNTGTQKKTAKHTIYFSRDGSVLFGINESSEGIQGVNIKSTGRYYRYDVPGVAAFGKPHKFLAKMTAGSKGELIFDGDMKINHFPSYRLRFSISVSGKNCTARFLKISAYGEGSSNIRLTPASAQCRIRRGTF